MYPDALRWRAKYELSLVFLSEVIISLLFSAVVCCESWLRLQIWQSMTLHYPSLPISFFCHALKDVIQFPYHSLYLAITFMNGIQCIIIR